MMVVPKLGRWLTDAGGPSKWSRTRWWWRRCKICVVQVQGKLRVCDLGMSQLLE